MMPPIADSFKDEQVVAVKKLIDSIKEIYSHDSYKLVDGHFNELERLREELADKEQELAAHIDLTTGLAKDRLSLQQSLARRDERIDQLLKENEDLEERFQRLEEQSKKQKGAIEKAKVKVKEQTDNLKAKDEQIQQL
jgi:chromosome segregation ATPase